MKNITYLPCILLLTAMQFSCGEKPNKSATSQVAATEIVSKSPQAQSKELDKKSEPEGKRILVTGYLDVPPENRASVSPYYGGYVKEINILPGQDVKKGEVLFTLQHPEYLKVQQAYLEAKEQLDYLKSDFERQKILSEEKISSTKNFKKAESDYKVMLARYHSLQEQIKLMGLSITFVEAGKLSNVISIKAPISGYVTSVNITKSVFADAQKVALELINVDHIHLELDIFEKDALSIKEGQPLSFKIPESGSQSYEGEIYLVGKVIDPKKRTVQVHGHIENLDEINFIPGMFVEAEIQIGN